MEPLISQLQSLRRLVEPIAIKIFDEEDPQSILPLVAQVIQNPTHEKTVEREWWDAFPEMKRWLDEKVLQSVFAESLKAKMEAFEITYGVDRWDVERGSALASVEDLAEKIPRGFILGKVNLALRVLRENLLTYDGQSFFDTDHAQPGFPDDAVSNIVPVNWVDPANPTIEEARAALREAQVRLLRQRVIKGTIIRSAAISQSLVVIVRNTAAWRVFEDVRTKEKIGQENANNEFRGTFELLMDLDPPAGQEQSFDVIHAVPNGPRPVLFVVSRDFSGAKFDEKDSFGKRLIHFGDEAEYGVAAAWWQTAVRVNPT
jgi:hypothetical protein